MRLKKAYLEITNLCNLSCSFCPGTGRRTGFLAPEDFRTLALRLRPHTEYLYLHLMGSPCCTHGWGSCWRSPERWASR